MKNDVGKDIFTVLHMDIRHVGMFSNIIPWQLFFLSFFLSFFFLSFFVYLAKLTPQTSPICKQPLRHLQMSRHHSSTLYLRYTHRYGGEIPDPPSCIPSRSQVMYAPVESRLFWSQENSPIPWIRAPCWSNDGVDVWYLPIYIWGYATNTMGEDKHDHPHTCLR